MSSSHTISPIFSTSFPIYNFIFLKPDYAYIIILNDYIYYSWYFKDISKTTNGETWYNHGKWPKKQGITKVHPPKKYGITMVDATKTWHYQNN